MRPNTSKFCNICKIEPCSSRSWNEKCAYIFKALLRRIPIVFQTGRPDSILRIRGNWPYFQYYVEKEMATHSSVLAWRIPWTEEHGRLKSMGSQRVGHD